MLGLLGALDPYKHKMNLGQIDTQVDSTALLSMTDLKEASHGTNNYNLDKNNSLNLGTFQLYIL